MKYFDWNPEKNRKLIKERGISFEICLVYIEQGKILDIIENKNPYEHQFVYVIEIDEYIYYVPFVEDEEKIFLKTIIPSRKATKKYLKP
ncbi:MAG: hypothetical protein UW27_C0010G0035 [Parcubacteria group bacterium GW2011_GWA1_44_13]|uniref:Toxin n=1 Tax=Candidatus Nomurabacteria bacterium GW2011_GWB1_44_12 TaxID=1618748 RepID=A0A837IDL1_9BACT|nr:MAG: hypothetical protein UW17_C0023G0008 [Candidatus Nomurabacteria bacterium GW2011_GWD1_44_10]KKT36961.1 MAG: hypothetical protein UW25_C0004G0289 [Candidatus Nomurabacteria bacterium GW2011_GWB1_44_12]KKT37755.1 MAG: hypothetical protein UW27_C0010G0035 [Parcubacteria group bacterium GW2011_GWA1_44_13]KKT59308.1 MAG: hypothetical protein UW54_C0029G0004 [Parcubacteria group bacterium GW2011_GWC1_44_26]HBB44317.1 toxin [Candidatus Yonathbacteria bacterium]